MGDVRLFCLECQGEDAAAVVGCRDMDCAFHDLRLKAVSSGANVPVSGQEQREARRAIRRFCMSCAGSSADVRHCAPSPRCVLHDLRFGVDPTTYARVMRRFAQQGSRKD